MVDKFRRLVRRKLELPENKNAIIFHPVAQSTREETRVLQELDREYRWIQIFDIGDETQIERIKRANERILGKELRDKLTWVSGESILLTSPTFNYKIERDILTLAERAVKMVRNSPERKAILRMNKIINPVDALPLGGQILAKSPSHIGSGKV